MKRKIILGVFLSFVLFTPFCYSQEIKNFDEFREAMLLANKTWNTIKPYSETKEFYQQVFNRKIVEDIDRLRKVPKFYGNTAVSTVVARFDSLQSFSNIELAVLLQDSLSMSNVTQWLEYNKGGTQFNKQPFHSGRYWPVFFNNRAIFREDLEDKKRFTFNSWPILLPLTTDSGAEFDGTVQWNRNPFPISIQVYGSHYPLAPLFEAVGLYDKAWRVQLEEEHISNRNVNNKSNYPSFYRRAANTAYRSGNKNLGWSFLMNAAVFEDEKYFELVMETAKVWIDVESGKRKLPEHKILTGAERKEIFLAIVKYYQDMNAHPRTWQFIQENKKEFDDADGLIKKIQDDWLNNIKTIRSIGFVHKITMYGVELYPAKNDPLSVKTPWAFPDGSIEILKAKIREIADKIKEEGSDGWINWLFSDGKLAARAKYIYCNDKEVIVERENGKRGTIAIEHLADYNKNYIYRRLAIRNMKVEDFCTLFHKWNFADKKLTELEAKYLSIDKENKITLQLKDGKKQIINLSDLNKTGQEYINLWKIRLAKEREEKRLQLEELKQKLLSEVRFRQWKSEDGFFNTQAKFISYDSKTNTVTIEKPDGKQTSMEYPDLCEEDKKYIKNLINPKLPEPKK
ncbi:MAG: hypothetical protein LBT09_00645 [Planctomycetaceae bacterium]|jgi:hypothetical protein|nr:hypothetical protein [Planctomycetaceae bacterium]